MRQAVTVEPPPPEREAKVVPISDQALLRRHVAGDPHAFAQLMKTYSAPIYGYLTRTGVPAPERDDLFQEVFERIHRAATRKLPPGPVRPWVFTITVNAVRSHFRKVRARSVVDSAADVEKETAARAPGADPERSASHRQAARRVEAQIRTLPLEQREALLLCTLEGLSVRQAAEALDVPVDTVKTRLRRARKALVVAHRRQEGTA